MTLHAKLRSLPVLLNIDAISCAGMGVGLIVAARELGHWTNLPSPLLTWAGILLLPIALFMAFSARLTPVPGWAAGVVIIGNIGWTLCSLVLPMAGIVSPNLIGWIFLIGQAGFVALMAFAEFRASRTAAAFA